MGRLYAFILTLTLVFFSHQNALSQRFKVNLSPTSASDQLSVIEARAGAAEHSWTSGLPLRSVGPSIMSGRVSDVAVAPGDGSEFFVAYASGGLWHTANNGTSFEPLFDDALTITLGAVALHPETRRLWVGTGEVNSSRSSYAGSGVYISDDHGKTWEHRGLTDTQHIGRIQLHPENPDIAWTAALGPLYSSNTSGGVYRTLNGGQDWTCVLSVEGIEQRAGAVDLILDPTDSDHLFAATWDRTRRAWNFIGNGNGSGIWETKDGGDTWKELSELKGFPNSEMTGRIGIAWHPTAKQLYAFVDNQALQTDTSTAEFLVNSPYSPSQFLEMSALEFASLDTTKLEDFLSENGFPESDSAASVFERIKAKELLPRALHDYLSDGNSALFETEIVGSEVYRLDLQGNPPFTWLKTHETPIEDVGYTYGYYFGLMEVDPHNPEHIWIAGVPLIESIDAGATWKSLGAPNAHVDHHYLWVNPNRPEHLINGNDGGINISWDGGKHWIKCNSPAVGQFYAIEVDHEDPYNIYGGLQDNGTWVGPSNYTPSSGWHQKGIYPWQLLSGGDGMQIEVDPRNSDILFTGSQFGWYNRIDREKSEFTSLHPQHQLGQTPFRWNWQTPIWLSRHQPDILYLASNRVHRSFNQGEDWETLSGDLTRGERQGNVPYGTITSLHESPLRFGQLAIGTDDGLIQISRDGGHLWNSIASPVPQDSKRDQTLWISEVLWSSHHEHRLYVALNGYRLDHFNSWIFVTENDGRTWNRLGGSELPAEPVNALVESATHEGVLFAGTDGGVYGSLNAGQHWGSIHPELPAVPVHDLVIQEREHELVIGTHGRSIWILELDVLFDHWKSEISWQDAMPDSVVLDAFSKVYFDENWGQQGWAWSEPITPITSAALFSPENFQGQWVISDDSTHTSWVADTVQIRRGWQSHSIPLQLPAASKPTFMTPGTYRISLQNKSGKELASSPLLISREEEE